jgi:Dolichyl-phosphate-mannose-protein mannosyltransferase
MRAFTAEADQPSTSSQRPNRLKDAATGVGKFLTDHLAPTSHSRPTRAKFAAICAAIFVSALCVRLLHWQDSHVEIVAGKTALSGVFNRYQKESRRILDEGGILYPREPRADGDARMLVHPPGYSILLATIYRLRDDPYLLLWLVQIACDGAAALLVFLIASELLNWRVALIAGMLVAFSPHLAYYSLVLSPDSLAVLPLLIAIYFLIRACERPRLITIMVAGAFIGLSCWLRANALLLAPLLAVVTLTSFPRGKRLRYSLALLGAAIVVISPITIRNLIVFHRFIPVSIAAGENLVVGIGDYDKEGRFGMPHSDHETRLKDAEWNARPDYAASLWTPDGIERDRVRLTRGLAVIRSNPGWFLGVMLRRAGFMLCYNDSHAHEWPFNTAVVPVVSAEARFGHPLPATSEREPLWLNSPAVVVMNGAVIPQSLALTGDNQPAWSSSTEELVAHGTALSPKTDVSLALDSQTLQVAGDDSEYGDQFESAVVPVHRDTDYVLAIPVKTVQGNMAIKITSADRRIATALAAIPEAEAETKRAGSENADGGQTAAHKMTVIQMPFASGKRTEIRIVLSNNASADVRPIVHIGQAQLFERAPTPYVWTRYVRVVVRALQRSLFTTSRMLPAVIIGLALLALAGRRRVIIILIAVPLYYLCAQSALSTEYRYILAIHYFLFVLSAVTFYSVLISVSQAPKWAMIRFASSKPGN